MISTVTISSTIETLYREVKVLLYRKSGARTAAQVAPFGIDSAPPKDMIAIYAETENKGQKVILGYLNRNLAADDGETRFYSLKADGSLSQTIWLRNDGTMEIGGSANFMVRFNQLKAGFDQLKSDHNALVTAFNSHVHAGSGVIPTPGVGIPAPASIASIDTAKITEIKTS